MNRISLFLLLVAVLAANSIAAASVAPYILTPPAPASPRINGASVFGVRPGSPFLFTIAATGDRPMTFSAQDLPEGLKLDPATGRITGALATKGEHLVMLGAKNSVGSVEKKFRIVCGGQIALTPPMCWSRAASPTTAGLTSTSMTSGRTIATQRTRRFKGRFATRTVSSCRTRAFPT
jgi:hypothetical protein